MRDDQDRHETTGSTDMESEESGTGRYGVRLSAAIGASLQNMMDMDYRLWFGMSAVLTGLIVAIIDIFQGDLVFATILLAAVVVSFVVLVWWTQPGRGGPHISHAAAQAAAQAGDVIIYWRPG